MQIDINTKMITLIGKPLSQSFSARMQNKAYEAAGLNMLFFYTELEKNQLGAVVNGLRYMNIAGFSITKPYKVDVLKYLDQLDPLCEKMGAANTVLKTKDGKLIGYNTDGIGFYTGFLEETNIAVDQCVFFCFGGGGAGRAICSILAYKGAKRIYVTDIFEESARALVNDINHNFAQVAEFVAYGDFSKIAACDVVLNASGIGMGHSLGETPLPKKYVQASQIFFDACYNPTKTQFLLNAEEKGCKIVNGLSMLLYQGVAQLELWAGVKPPVKVMRQELLDILAEVSTQESDKKRQLA